MITLVFCYFALVFIAGLVVTIWGVVDFVLFRDFYAGQKVKEGMREN